MQVNVYAAARDTISRDVERLTSKQEEDECESSHNHRQKTLMFSVEDVHHHHHQQQQQQQQRPSQQHFATFPLIRSTPTMTRPPPAAAATDDTMTSLPPRRPHHDDVITTLMITHSGEPLGVGLNAPAHQDVGVVDRPLSVPVTVPEPTSFHQDGSQIRRQLLDYHRSLLSHCTVNYLT